MPDAVYMVNDTPHPDPDKRKDWLPLARKFDKHIVDARAPEDRAALVKSIQSGEVEIVKITVGCDLSDAEGVRR